MTFSLLFNTALIISLVSRYGRRHAEVSSTNTSLYKCSHGRTFIIFASNQITRQCRRDSSTKANILKKKMVSNAAVLPREYLVERIICKKSTNEGDLFLIKWQGYHPQESTWKPARHISGDLVTLYLSPTVSPERLHAAAEAFERAVQQRLSTKNSTVTTEFSLDIYRSVFGTDEDVLVTSYQELSKLPLCRNWYYKINKYGRGARLSLPMRLQPRCFMRPVYVRTEDQTFVKMSLPVEEIVLISAIEPFK